MQDSHTAFINEVLLQPYESALDAVSAQQLERPVRELMVEEGEKVKEEELKPMKKKKRRSSNNPFQRSRRR